MECLKSRHWSCQDLSEVASVIVPSCGSPKWYSFWRTQSSAIDVISYWVVLRLLQKSTQRVSWIIWRCTSLGRQVVGVKCTVGLLARPLVPPVEFLFEGLTDPRCILLSPNKAFCVCHYPPTMDRGEETYESVLFVCERRAENWFCFIISQPSWRIIFRLGK